jgi:hypothetical protein
VRDRSLASHTINAMDQCCVHDVDAATDTIGRCVVCDQLRNSTPPAISSGRWSENNDAIDSDPYRVWEQISEEQREQVIDDLVDTFIRKRMTGMEITDDMRAALAVVMVAAVKDEVAAMKSGLTG